MSANLTGVRTHSLLGSPSLEPCLGITRDDERPTGSDVMRPGVRWRAAFAALGMSMLALGAVGGGVQAADDLHVRYQASENSCVDGVSNFPLSALSLLDHDTLVDNALPFAVDGVTGRFQACFPTGLPASGLRLVAFRDGDGQTDIFTIPALSAHIDRVTDVVKGLSRANHDLTLRVYDCDLVIGKVCPRVLTRTVRTNASGRYATDLSSRFDLRGTDTVSVTLGTSQGSTWRIGRSVPYLDARMATPLVNGQINPGEHALLSLRTAPGGNLLATRAAVGAPILGSFGVVFGSSLSTGQQLSGDFASDARVTLPRTAMSFPIARHEQTIEARCLPNRRMLIYWQSLGVGFARRTADSHGRATVRLASVEHPGFRLSHASEVTVACQDRAGDIVERSITVP